MKKYRTTLFSVAGLSMLLVFAGCAAMQVAGDVQQGRTKLLAGEPKAALAHFQQAARLDPGYVANSSSLHQSVWTYVGRAHYDGGNLADAVQALERARSRYDDDHLAELYLGLTMLRDGNRQQGLKNLESGMKGLRDRLDWIVNYTPIGDFWDPGEKIRSAIEANLAMISGKDIDTKKLITNGEWLGKELEEEVDRARWDERHDRLLDGGDNEGEEP